MKKLIRIRIRGGSSAWISVNALIYTIQIPTDRLHENAARVRTLHVVDATKLLFFNLCRQFSGSAKRGAGTGLINTSPAGRTKLAGR